MRNNISKTFKRSIAAIAVTTVLGMTSASADDLVGRINGASTTSHTHQKRGKREEPKRLSEGAPQSVVTDPPSSLTSLDFAYEVHCPSEDTP